MTAHRFVTYFAVFLASSAMQDFEQLGVFYLGRQVDPETVKPTQDLLLFDSKDLTTHAVCVGMTGSGKTGLCLTLLEEAAIDGVPAIAIDPKGDLGNLLLTFPQLRPEDYRPWLDPADAERKGVSLDEYAQQVAAANQAGLAEWGQDGARIERLRSAADIAIYTPGSNAGLPLTVLRSFAAPPKELQSDSDAFREHVIGAVSGLLALIGISADPLKSREHILVANLLERAWREGRDVDLSGLIRGIQSPPFDKVGLVDLESFYPAKQRFELSMTLNNLLASPGFSAWMEGEPLDIQRLLFTAQGRPRLSILSIAHLSDAERMFFVTILCNEMIAWMRRQSGTSSLRAILYMDEVFGYFPPSANPPSKTPMLTLLKQARAFGLGIVLATQNPVDLDYKGLSNAGTWLLGRLQTERDKARVLDGLEGAAGASGTAFDRAQMERLLSGLGKRIFLMNNVHDDHPVLFQSRWALSYLRGPLTRDQIQQLMQDRKGMPIKGTPGATTATAEAAPSSPKVTTGGGARPVLPPGIAECFVPQRRQISGKGKLVYRPALVGIARVHFSQAASSIDVWQDVALFAPPLDSDREPGWDDAEILVDEPPELEQEPEPEAEFAPLPSSLTNTKTYTSLSTSAKNHLYQTHRLSLWKATALKQTSLPGEEEGTFRSRLSQSLREQRDLLVAKLRDRYAPKLAAIQEQIRRAQQKLEKEKSDVTQQALQTALSMGSSVLGALFGRKLASAANMNRAASSMRAASKVAKERREAGHAEETAEALQQRFEELEAAFKTETEGLQSQWSAEKLELVEQPLQPKKADITISKVVLAWLPFERTADGGLERA